TRELPILSTGRPPAFRWRTSGWSSSRTRTRCRNCGGRAARTAVPRCPGRSTCCAPTRSIPRPTSSCAEARTGSPTPSRRPRARRAGEAVRPDRVRARVEAQGPGHVLFSRTYFPAWKARLNGNPERVLGANGRDLAVAVPAGTHELEIAYDPGPFRIGVAIQAAALVCALGAVIGTRR